MKLLLLATGFLLAVSATPVDEWNQYKVEHNKVYTSQVEDNRRLEQYLKNKKMVEEHNRKYARGETTYTMGINHFSDWFPEELSKILGFKLDYILQGRQKFELPAGTKVPDSIDWVEKGAVTSVKNQGQCGSCYAFSAVGALEGLMFTTNKTITDLSVQQIVDCNNLTFGCDGGFPENCFTYVANWGGIEKNESYPYVAVTEKCRASKEKVVMTCTGYKNIADEKVLTRVVGTVGPVSIGFDVENSFFHYKSGIYQGDCDGAPNHGMVVVGYDKDNVTNKDYWLIKNSWGTKWGEKGYARVLRNVDMCGVGDYASYPIYSDKN